jgi:hypothetical protein
MARDPVLGNAVMDFELREAIDVSVACVGEQEFAEIEARAMADALVAYDRVARCCG